MFETIDRFVPVQSKVLVWKPTNWDFTTAYKNATTITVSNLPSYVTQLASYDIASIYRFKTDGSLYRVYMNDQRCFTISWADIIFDSAKVTLDEAFVSTDKFVVYTTIPASSSSTWGWSANLLPTAYNAASFNLADSTSDYDVKAWVAASFWTVAKVWYLKITSSKDITIKFNSASNAWYVASAASFPLIIEWLGISNLYLTNASWNISAISILSY